MSDERSEHRSSAGGPRRVAVAVDNGVADVRLNRADKLNALDAAMFQALAETGSGLASEPSLRAVVLSGEGRGFCAGLDVGSFGAMAKGGGTGPNLLERPEGRFATHAQLAAHVWSELPVPVIAALHGVIFGGGLQIALAADIRLVTPDARLSVMEIKWGLIPDMTGSQTLRRLVRLDVAKELTFTGRIVSGIEAVELGLATHVSDDPHAEALELAHGIAGRSPDAIRAGKRLLDESALVDLETGLRREAELQAKLIGSANQVETVKANLEQRAPNFRDPE
jgi:enoyl-CoA hydratase/carnithine racemase